MLKTIEFTVDSMLRMSATSVKLFPEVADKICKLCTHENPDYIKWKAYKKGPKPPKTIESFVKEKNGRYAFPRGIISKIGNIVDSYVVNVTDSRVEIKAPLLEWKGPPARRSQRRLIEDGLKRKRAREWTAMIWRAPPGSGKTNAILELVANLGLKTLIVCPTDAIFTQWIERSESHLGTKAGIIQGSKINIGEVITVVKQRTLWLHVDKFADEFGAVIFDEAQLASARTYQESLNKLPAMFRLAVSGDERRSDGKEFLAYDQFGEVSQEITREESKSEGGIVDVKVLVVPSEFKAKWYKSLKPAVKFQTRTKLLDQIAEDSMRNNLIVRTAVDYFQREGQQVAVLAARREHCQKIDSLLCHYAPSVLLMGGDHTFAQNRAAFASGEAKFAVGTYQKVGVGFESHKELGRGVFASPVASNAKGKMQFAQFLGRYARPSDNKYEAEVAYIADVHVFGKKPIKLICQWIGHENVFVLDNGKKVPAKAWLSKFKESDYDD